MKGTTWSWVCRAVTSGINPMEWNHEKIEWALAIARKLILCLKWNRKITFTAIKRNILWLELAPWAVIGMIFTPRNLIVDNASSTKGSNKSLETTCGPKYVYGNSKSQNNQWTTKASISVGTGGHSSSHLSLNNKTWTLPNSMNPIILPL